jgi:chemotaxis signal transduction protein
VEHGDELVGFIVESVTGVKRLSNRDLELAPKLALSTDTPFVKGVFRSKDEMVVLLDAHKILTPEELSTVGEISHIADANRRELQ